MFQSRRFVMVAATALAAVAATAVFMYEHGIRNSARDHAGATVMVATQDIPAGTVLGTGSDPTLVTMALRPKDAQKLVYAQEEGSVWLALLPPHQHGARVPAVTFAGIDR